MTSARFSVVCEYVNRSTVNDLLGPPRMFLCHSLAADGIQSHSSVEKNFPMPSPTARPADRVDTPIMLKFRLTIQGNRL